MSASASSSENLNFNSKSYSIAHSLLVARLLGDDFASPVASPMHGTPPIHVCQSSHFDADPTTGRSTTVASLRSPEFGNPSSHARAKARIGTLGVRVPVRSS
jgi:hypothetical protein